MNPYINKFLVALVTVLGAAGLIVQDGISTEEWLVMAVLALNAFGVYAIPNAPPPR